MLSSVSYQTGKCDARHDTCADTLNGKRVRVTWVIKNRNHFTQRNTNYFMKFINGIQNFR